jgi:hypothetical protein
MVWARSRTNLGYIGWTDLWAAGCRTIRGEKAGLAGVPRKALRKYLEAPFCLVRLGRYGNGAEICQEGCIEGRAAIYRKAHSNCSLASDGHGNGAKSSATAHGPHPSVAALSQKWELPSWTTAGYSMRRDIGIDMPQSSESQRGSRPR